MYPVFVSTFIVVSVAMLLDSYFCWPVTASCLFSPTVTMLICFLLSVSRLFLYHTQDFFMERWNGEVSTATCCFFCGIFWITLYLIPRAGIPSGLLQPLSRYGLADLPQSLFLLDLVAPGNFLFVITSISIQIE
jgi:hypothetical protein